MGVETHIWWSHETREFKLTMAVENANLMLDETREFKLTVGVETHT